MSNNIVDTYKTAAQSIFGAFLSAFEIPYGTVGGPGYWRLGTSFDTMTDYLLLLNQSKVPSDNDFYKAYKTRLQEQLKETDWTKRVDPYAQYLRTMMNAPSSSCAYDDFCWWGIAFSKALPESPYHKLFMDLFGQELTTVFQNTSKAIWEVVFNGNYEAVVQNTPENHPDYARFKADFLARPKYHGGSPNPWTRVQNDTPAGLKAAFDGASPTQIGVKPLFEGGLWQYDYYYNSQTGDGKFPDSCGQNGDPSEAPGAGYIGPYQLTLMSSLGLIFTTRLHSWTGEAKGGNYITAAEKVHTFLQQWFQVPQDSGYSLLWHYDNDNEKALLRERVGKYASGKEVPGYEMITSPKSKRVWCGDQGLMLAALLEFSAATGTNTTSTTASQLLRGTLDSAGPLFTGVNDGKSFQILQPYSPAVDGTDWYMHLFRFPDYWSGTGIFWRYLFQTYRSGNSDVQSIVKSSVAATDNVLTRSAEAAVAAAKPIDTSTPKNLRGPDLPWSTEPWSTQGWGNDSPLFKWFNSLAALTAAIAVMDDTEA